MIMMLEYDSVVLDEKVSYFTTEIIRSGFSDSSLLLLGSFSNLGKNAML